MNFLIFHDFRSMPGPRSQIGQNPKVPATPDTPELADNLRHIFFFYRVLYTPGTPQKPKEITGTARHALQKKISLPGFSRKSLFSMYVCMYVRGHRDVQKSSYRAIRSAVGKCARQARRTSFLIVAGPILIVADSR